MPNDPQLDESFRAVTATTVAQLVDLGAEYPDIVIHNDGAVSVYVNASGGDATVNSYPLAAGATLTLDKPLSTLRAGRRYISVMSASSTAAMRIGGWR